MHIFCLSSPGPLGRSLVLLCCHCCLLFCCVCCYLILLFCYVLFRSLLCCCFVVASDTDVSRNPGWWDATGSGGEWHRRVLPSGVTGRSRERWRVTLGILFPLKRKPCICALPSLPYFACAAPLLHPIPPTSTTPSPTSAFGLKFWFDPCLGVCEFGSTMFVPHPMEVDGASPIGPPEWHRSPWAGPERTGGSWGGGHPCHMSRHPG